MTLRVSLHDSRWPSGVADTAPRPAGGYATHARAQERFVFAIPEAIESVHAASMMCAGATVYSPLFRNNAGPGKKVGVIGIGG